MQPKYPLTHMSRSVLSLVVIVSSLALAIAPITQAEAPNPNDLLQSQSHIVDGLTQEERAARIDGFYRAKGNLPLAGYGMHMVRAADAYGVDWRLIAAIGFIESTGGKFMIKRTHNAWGWGGGTIVFNSYEEAIDSITRHLAGLEPKTAKWYAGKTLAQVIDTYNPPSIRGDYKKIVTNTMDTIATSMPDMTFLVAR